MRWAPGSSNRNIEDRRGQRIGMAPVGIGGAIRMLILGLIFGPDVINNGTTDTTQQAAPGDVAPVQQSPQEAREVQLVTFVLDTSQMTWSQLLPQTYHRPGERRHVHPRHVAAARELVQEGVRFG